MSLSRDAVAIMTVAPPKLVETSFVVDVTRPLPAGAIDLRRVRFAQPGGIAALAVYVENAIAVGRPPSLVLAPEDSSAANYLSRARIPGFLDERGVAHSFVSVRERNLGARLVPLSVFRGALEINVLAASAFEFAEQARPGAGTVLHTAICEAGENAITHSRVAQGFAVAQYFPSLREFVFAIGDAGRGLYGSLVGRGATDAASATSLALKPGLSATGDDGRGYGLSTIVQQIHSLGGTAFFATGDHHLIRMTRGQVPTSLNGVVTGTIIAGRFRV